VGQSRYSSDDSIDRHDGGAPLRIAELVCTRCVPESKYMILMRTTRALQPSKYGPSSGAPGRIRTCDARLRSPALYPLSYEGGAAGACPNSGCGGPGSSPMLPEASGSYFDRPLAPSPTSSCRERRLISCAWG
jgi:hypothetical protein